MWKIISIFIGAFILMLSCYAFGRYILNKNIKVSFYKFLVLMLGLSLLFLFTVLLNISFLRTILSFIFYYLVFKVIFKINNYQSILITLIYYVMLLCGDILFILLCTLCLKLSGSQLYLILGGTIISNLSVGILCLLFGLIFKKLINKLLDIEVKKITLIYWLIIFLILCLFFVFSFTNKSYSFETYIVLVMVFVIIIIILVSFWQNIKNNELENKYDKLLEFIKKYEAEIDKQRTMRHETKNQLLMIKSKLIDKDNQKNVISYIDEIIKDNNKKINHSEYAKLRYLPSNGLKGLFYFKVDEAIDKGIHVDINVSKSVENSFLYKLNSINFNQIGKVLGIFLDNAIEGAIASCDKVLGIEVYLSNNYINFIISNSYLKINDNLKSTKGINRGHGLLLAKTIIKSNNKFNNETEITEKLFIQKLSIKK